MLSGPKLHWSGANDLQVAGTLVVANQADLGLDRHCGAGRQLVRHIRLTSAGGAVPREYHGMFPRHR